MKSLFSSFSYFINQALRLFPVEYWIFLLFVGGNLYITNNKPYVLLLAVYAGILYITNHNATISIWYTFLGSLLFYKAKYFIVPFVSQIAVSLGLNQETFFTYYVAFFDGLLILLVYFLFKNRQKLKMKTPVFIELLLLVFLLGVGALSSIYSQFDNVSWFSLARIFEYVMLFTTSMIMLSDQKVFRVTLSMVLTFISLNAVLIIVQKFLGGPVGIVLEDVSTGMFGRFADEIPGLYRPGGIYFEPNLPASLINMILPLVFYLSFGLKTFINQKMTKVIFVLLVIALIFTGSRANWIIGLIALTLSYAYLNNKKRLTKLTLHKRTVVAIIVLCIFILPIITQRASTIGQALNDKRGSLAFRIQHLTMAKEFMLARLWGVGVDGFQYQILDSYKPGDYFANITAPHNILAEVGSGFGVVGLGIFLLFILLVYKRLIPLVNSKNNASGLNMVLLIGYSTYLLSAQFYPWLFAPPLSEISWIFLGGLYAGLQTKPY